MSPPVKASTGRLDPPGARRRSPAFFSSSALGHGRIDCVLAILHRPSDLRVRPVDHHHPGRRRRDGFLAPGAISADHPADGPGQLPVSRGQRPGGGRDHRRPHRTTGQRRGGHAVHVLAIHQRRPVQPDRHLQERRRSQHGPGAGAEPRQPGPAAAARRHPQDRPDHQEAVARHPAGHQPHFPGWTLRPALPEQLRASCRFATSWPACPASAT